MTTAHDDIEYHGGIASLVSLSPVTGRAVKTFIGGSPHADARDEHLALQFLERHGLAAPREVHLSGALPAIEMGLLDGRAGTEVLREDPLGFTRRVARYLARLAETEACGSVGSGWDEQFDSRAISPGEFFADLLQEWQIDNQFKDERLAVSDLARVDLRDSRIVRLHGDLKAEHVVFLASTNEPALLDWAFSARGPQAWDAGHLLWDVLTFKALSPARTRQVVNEVQSSLRLDESALRCGLAGAAITRADHARGDDAPLVRAAAREMVTQAVEGAPLLTIAGIARSVPGRLLE